MSSLAALLNLLKAVERAPTGVAIRLGVLSADGQRIGSLCVVDRKISAETLTAVSESQALFGLEVPGVPSDAGDELDALARCTWQLARSLAGGGRLEPAPVREQDSSESFRTFPAAAVLSRAITLAPREASGVPPLPHFFDQLGPSLEAAYCFFEDRPKASKGALVGLYGRALTLARVERLYREAASSLNNPLYKLVSLEPRSIVIKSSMRGWMVTSEGPFLCLFRLSHSGDCGQLLAELARSSVAPSAPTTALSFVSGLDAEPRTDPRPPSKGELEMSLNNILTEIVHNVPECIAAGVVDMSTGMLLGIRTVDSHPQEVIDILAAATGDLFQGSNVLVIEGLFKRSRGVPESDRTHYFQEFIALSQNLIHVFIRSKKVDNCVLVTVCRGGANLGMVLAKTRSAMPGVEAAS